MTRPEGGKIVPLERALEAVADGMQIGIGGWIFHGQPMALVRGLVRGGRRGLRLLPAPGSVAPDLLIGAGCVEETACVFLSFEHLGLAPNFRRTAQAGELRVLEMDGPGMAGGLRAGACDLPYGLIPDLGTDLPRVNPEGYRRARVADGGRPLLEVPALAPDVVLLHGQQADELGNVQYFGAAFFDFLLAQAGKHVICSVDRVVPTAVMRAAPHRTKLPSAFVDAVVVAPYGAHPGSSPGLYAHDEVHLRRYVAAARTAESFSSYLDDYVRGTLDEDGYRNRIGGGRIPEDTFPPSL